MKKESKKGVSVIIPTFNRTMFLYPTLICLNNQQVEEKISYEIIIVDSGSDDTELMINAFQSISKVPIIYKKIKKCKNRSLLRNTGAALANYSILCFLDNDMLTPPDFIQTHFDEHIKNMHLVLLGCRKNLIKFDFSQIGEEALQTDYRILEQLPYYTDDRLYLYNDNEPWRFVFSHTLSIERSDYIKAGGFNIDFGEHWGFEDLELGFGLQLTGCKFKLLRNQFTYHQPHFEQSNKEQHEMSYNAKLFIQLHNCFECELYESFYTSFDEFYPILANIKKDFVIPNKKIQNQYDLIFACLFSSMENVPYKNMYLGAYSMKKDKSCKNLLIIDIFFRLPQIIQMSIIAEAFRISACVCIQNKEQPVIKEFIRIANAVGLVIDYKTEKERVIFTKNKDINANIFIMLLPDIYEPEKRYVYSWFAAYMLKNGTFVNVRDKKKAITLKNDDFCLSEESRILIENNFERSFGKAPVQFINSLSMLLLDSTIGVPNSTKSFILHDEDYKLKFNSLKFRKLPEAYHFDEATFAYISFLSILEETEKYHSRKHVVAVENSYCCFMENGYKEDGIDLILDAFSGYIKSNNLAKITIKIPDYSLFEKAIYPLHNEISKVNKLFAGTQKRAMDIISLNQKIKELKLENNITILQKNLSIKDVVELIGNHKTFLFASRGCIVPPQVYISIIMGRNTIIGQHHMILNQLKRYCSIIEAVPCEFAEEINVPASCLNRPYIAFRMNSKEILNTSNIMQEKLSNEVKNNITKEAHKFINTYFVKNKSFVEG